MNFDFSEEQKNLQHHAAKLLKTHCPASEVHRILNSDDLFSAPLWQAIVEGGWTATALPEAYGGFGMGYLELCVLAQELGRACAPVPFSSAVYLAAEALLIAGNASQKDKWLPQLADGRAFGTLAWVERTGPELEDARCRVSNDRLSGCKIAVPDGASAQYAIVSARHGISSGLFIAPLNHPGVSRQLRNTLDDSRSYAEIQFNQVPVDALGHDGDAESVLNILFSRAAVLMAFEQLGGAEATLEMARKHACERQAFGRAIGSFQAIKHKLARLYVEIELARSNCYHGAYALSSDSTDLPIAAATARLSAGAAYTMGAEENIQVHGGSGISWDGDCQLHYRRARLLGLALGGDRHWKERLVEQLHDIPLQDSTYNQAAHGL